MNRGKKKILFVFGTRPEAIKLAPLILDLRKRDTFEVMVCSTGQHREMLKPIFQFFGISVDYDLDLMKPGQSLTDISVGVMLGLKDIVSKDRPDLILAQGDTTSCFIASLFAFYNQIPLVHVEAGLRSGDILSPFPEEFNRCATSLVADLHFAPTVGAKAHLLSEGIAEEKIFVTGNTGIDSLVRVSNEIDSNEKLKQEYTKRFSFLNPKKKMILVTIHRRESFGKPMREIMKGLLNLSQRNDVQLLIPLHMNPEVQNMAREVFEGKAIWLDTKRQTQFQEATAKNIFICEPQEYVSFVYLMKMSHFIVTDSGGVQEEAPGLGKPILVARENTERPEAIAAGTSKLIPLTTEGFSKTASELLDDQVLFQQMSKAVNPFGDGQASERIIKVLSQKYLEFANES